MKKKAAHWIAVALLTAWSGPAAQADERGWLGAFGHVPTAYDLSPPVTVMGRDGNPRTVTPNFAPASAYPANSTVRAFARLSAAATSVRIRLSNEFSAHALRIGEAHIALAGADGAIIPGSDRLLTFSGQRGAAIPPGAPLLSDPLSWTLPALSKLAVTVFYPQETVPPAHILFTLQAWAAPGNQADAQSLTGAVAARGGNHLSEIDIVPQMPGHTVVCFGDSITEGVGSTQGAFRGWPDRLAERLQADPATRGWSVVNAGIGSNRLLHDTPSVNALARFDRDVLAVPGVEKVIILMGINDIQYSHRFPSQAVTADEMIAALGQLVSRAHARGVKIIGGTITPFAGSGDYTAEGDAARTKVNDWIRGGGAFDGVIDFDLATRDPLHPGQLSSALDSGGRLHPNDAGYALMGDAIDLRLFAQ